MTKQPARIAVIDNDQLYLDSLVSFLETAGFAVVTATSVDEGRELLKQEGLDLAIMDIRLKDDKDETDKEGLELVKTLGPDFEAAIIMLTGHPEHPDVITAMRPRMGGRPAIAVDFVDKAEGPQGILLAIERVRQAREQLDSALRDAQKREQILFWLRNIMAILGMVLIFVTVGAVAAGAVNAAAPAGVATVITSAIWGLFGTQHKQAQDRVKELQSPQKSNDKQGD